MTVYLRVFVLLVLCNSAAHAANSAKMQAELQAALPNGRAGIAVGLVSSKTQTTQFVGNPKFTDATLFEYGSITKVFTAIVLAELVQERAVGLGDSVNAYLPESVKDEKWQNVTLESLATHTAGLPRLPPTMNLLYMLRWGADPYAHFDEAMLFRAVQQVRLEPAGQLSAYSNFGFGLLGTLLARATKTPYKTLVENRIFKPLRMRDATMTGWSSKDIASPLTLEGDEANYWNWDALAGAGAARGSLTDALKFLRAAMAACKTSGTLAKANCKAQQATEVQAGKYAAQGLGWIRFGSRAGDIVWHNGGTGGYSSFLGFNALTGEGLVLLANVGDLGELLTQTGLEHLAAQK